jgi:hypothetical protein
MRLKAYQRWFDRIDFIVIALFVAFIVWTTFFPSLVPWRR